MLQSGKCTADDIDTYIDKWHDEYNGPKKLYEYLGMTEQQYGRWLVDPSALALCFQNNITTKKTNEVCVAGHLIY